MKLAPEQYRTRDLLLWVQRATARPRRPSTDSQILVKEKKNTTRATNIIHKHVLFEVYATTMHDPSYRFYYTKCRPII